jgi:acyl-coenzyme A thioesterase PaaI-like protein
MAGEPDQRPRAPDQGAHADRPGGDWVTRDDVLPPDARACFACGEDNPIGMHLADIRRDGERIRATLHPKPEYQGYPGVLHGGLSATALDEVMGYASILVAGIWAATATMETRYRTRVPLDVPLSLTGGVTEARGRRVHAWSKLHLPDGTVGAEATGVLVRLPEEMARRVEEVYGELRAR